MWSKIAFDSFHWVHWDYWELNHFPRILLWFLKVVCSLSHGRSSRAFSLIPEKLKCKYNTSNLHNQNSNEHERWRKNAKNNTTEEVLTNQHTHKFKDLSLCELILSIGCWFWRTYCEHFFVYLKSSSMGLFGPLLISQERSCAKCCQKLASFLFRLALWLK